MAKKILTFTLLPLILTACNSYQAVEIASDEENKLWEHSTPNVSVAENANFSTHSSLENGWIPEGQAVDLMSETFSPVELKPTVRHRIVKDDVYTASYETSPEVVRYDRYLLVDSSPETGQKYLLEQIVSVNMKGVGLTVEQGIWNTLSGTGYRLCTPIDQSVLSLFNLTLPRIHYKFGPVRLRDALQVLAGEAYELMVNDALRQICYVPRESAVSTKVEPKTVIYADSER